MWLQRSSLEGWHAFVKQEGSCISCMNVDAKKVLLGLTENGIPYVLLKGKIAIFGYLGKEFKKEFVRLFELEINSGKIYVYDHTF